MKIGAVVVAAGKSERMGRNKLLIKLKGKTLLEHVLDSISSSCVRQIIVVVGHKPWELNQVLDNPKYNLKVVTNKNYERGMLSSFKKGLGSILDTDAVFLVLGDQLIVDPHFLDQMANVIQANRQTAKIVSPLYRKVRGHPVLLSNALYDQIMSLGDDKTLHDLISNQEKSVVALKAKAWTAIDIDRPEDVVAARRYVSGYNQKTRSEKSKAV